MKTLVNLGPLCILGLAIAAFGAEYTTYTGDSNDFRIAKAVTVADGSTYVAGTRVAGQRADAYVMKFDPSGSLIMRTAVGGTHADTAAALAVDADGNVYVAGATSSPDFPLLGAVQTNPGRFGATGFLVKLRPNGSVVYSTYFGGVQGNSSVKAIAVDASQNVYLTGNTCSDDFPRTIGVQSAPLRCFSSVGALTGAFLAKLSAAGDRIIYSAVIAGSITRCGAGAQCRMSSRETSGVAIALDDARNVYVGGYTNTPDLPTTPGALRTSGIGAFVAKVNAGGDALNYLTYLGAANDIVIFANPGNRIAAIAVDAAGNAYLAGKTSDPDFPTTPGAYRTMAPNEPRPRDDAFAAKLNPEGTAMVWATRVGGSGDDSAQAIAVDPAGNVWLTGTTSSADFPNMNGWSRGSDFLIGLNPSGSSLIYSARFPDSAVSQAVGIDGAGAVHLAGPGGIVSAIEPTRSPSPRIFGIRNLAAGPVGGRIAPGELIAIDGPQIGPRVSVRFTGDPASVPTSIGGVQVFFDGIPAPLLYASENQVHAIVSLAIANQSARLRLVFDDAALPAFPVGVTTASPEIFRNPDGSAAARNSAAALNEDGTVNSPENPAKAGSVLAIWATGTGRSGCDCVVAVNSSFQAAVILYAGPAPALVTGIMQINFRIPEDAFRVAGAVTITLTLGSPEGASSSSPVRIYVADGKP